MNLDEYMKENNLSFENLKKEIARLQQKEQEKKNSEYELARKRAKAALIDYMVALSERNEWTGYTKDVFVAAVEEWFKELEATKIQTTSQKYQTFDDLFKQLGW